MLYPAATQVPGDLATAGKPTAPHAPPGRYAVRLSVNDAELSQEFEIARDPRVSATQADLQEKFELHTRIRDRLSEVNDRHHRTAQREAAGGRVGGPGKVRLCTGSDDVARVSSRLIEGPRQRRKTADEGRLPRRSRPSQHAPTINTRLAELCEVVAVADFAPPRQAYDVFEVLSRRAGEELAALRTTIDAGVAELDRLIREHGVPNFAGGVRGDIA